MHVPGNIFTDRKADCRTDREKDRQVNIQTYVEHTYIIKILHDCMDGLYIILKYNFFFLPHFVAGEEAEEAEYSTIQKKP